MSSHPARRLTSALLMPFSLASALPLSEARAQATGAQDPLIAGIDSIFARYDSSSSPGCAVGVRRNGRVVARRDYGMADIAGKRPIAGNSLFPVQSVNKMFNAFAILRLAEQRKLKLDDHIGRWIPALSGLDSGVTLRRLIQHTSGRPDIGVVVQLRGESEESSLTPDSLVRLIASFPRSMFEPGTREAYANDAQQLLPLVIERAYGKSLATAMQELVFKPTGMLGSTYRLRTSVRVPMTVTPYRRDDGRPVASTMIRAGVLVTRDDLLAWSAAWLSPPDSLAAAVRRMRERAMLPNGSWTSYGLGLQYIEYNNTIAWYHGGDNRTEGHSIVIHWPELHSAVVVLCNDGDADVTALGVATSERALQGLFPDVPRQPAAVRSASKLAGLYFTVDGGPSTVRFSATADSLRIMLSERDARVLSRLNDETFAVVGSPIRWIFRGDTLWRALGLSVQRYDRVTEAGTVRDDISGCYVNRAIGIRGMLRNGANGPELRWLPDTTWHGMRAIFDDAFTDGFAWLRLKRGPTARVTGAVVYTDRVWGISLERVDQCEP